MRPALSHPLVIALAALLGGLAGLGFHAVAGAPVQASQRILVPAVDLMPVPGVRPFTLDGEALLVTSDPVIRSVTESLDMSPREVHDSIEVGAEPNTRVLVVTFSARDSKEAIRGVELVTASYLQERGRLKASANRYVSDLYGTRLDQLDSILRETVAVAPPTPGVVLATAISDIRTESLDTAHVLTDLSDNGVGRVISTASVVPASDVATVRLASGLAVGLLLGAPCAHRLNHRHLRLGAAPGKRLGRRLAVLTRVTEHDVDQAARFVNAFLPVAGVAADPHSPRSLRLAILLDEGLGAQHHGGRRSLIVVEPRSRVGTVRSLYDEQVRAGLHPVGLIVCEPSRRRG